MTDNDNSDVKKEQLRQAIAAQEGLRATLGDAIVDATIAALNKQLTELESTAAQQQRKLMTVLFVDVVGSTRLLQGLDPEENLAIMDAALRRLANPIEARGGRVLRFMGDGFKAAFGLPRARENDPEMAVRAGLELQEAARQLAAELARERQLEGFQVRVGINTGLVVTGGETEGEEAVVGLTVNLAARLESAAPPGGLLISQATYLHVRGLFEFEPGDAIEAKGFAEPVPVYKVLRAKPRSFGMTSRGVEGVETSMIGREAELATLREATHAVDRERRGRFITVVGEAGLGKSRLLGEFEDWLEHGETAFELLKGQATLETLDLPYGLLRELIAHQVGILEDDPPPRAREKLVAGFRKALADEADFEQRAHFVGQLLGYDFGDSPHLRGILDDPRQLRDRALIHVANYLGALAAERILVIFLDDVHWADGSSLDVLLQLFDRLQQQRVLVVSLTRPTFFERLPSWEHVAQYQRLDLQPLSRRDSRRLVGEVLQKVEALPEALRDLIIEHAEGNPFYLEELIKMLVEDGVIVKSEPQWHVHPDRLGVVHIPPTLTGVIQARLEGLPERERRILQQAAVVGRVFWDEAVCYLNQEPQPSRAREAITPNETKQELAALQAREMIFEQLNSAFSDAAEFLFKHSVLREVTYESVLKRLRREYHAMVADWLIEHSGDRVEQISGLIAGHLEKAGKNEEALDYLSQAAEAAAANYALKEALDFFTRALALTPADDLEKRFTLLRGRAKILAVQGNRAAQRDDVQTMTSLADTLADDRMRAQASMGRAWLAYWTGDYPATAAEASEALRIAETAQLQELSGEAYHALAWASIQVGNYEDALDHATEGLELGRKLEDLRTEKNLVQSIGMIHLALGNYSEAREFTGKAIELSRELGDPASETTAKSNFGVAVTLLGDYQVAREMYQYELDFSHETGNVISEGTALVNLAWISAAQGAWEKARDYALAGIEIEKRVDHKEAEAEALVWLGNAFLGLEQPQKAIAAYRESVELRRKLDQAHLATGAVAGLARAALARGDMTSAAEHVQKILRYLNEDPTLHGTWEPLRIFLTCVRVLEQLSDPRAEEILEQAAGLLQERAERIQDEDDRRRYLENVPWHRELLAAWRSRQQAT